jgi:hypothetical protein
MNNIFRAMTTVAGIIVLGTALAPRASAGCGAAIGGKRAALHGKSSFVMAAYREDVDPIVGLWQFTMTSKGSAGIPDGTVVDAGYTTWHSDGTELMNSGRAPLTGSFCMGVWMSPVKYSYVLNHFAMAWDATGNVYLGPTNIKENLTLDYSGTAFTGTFTITQFDTHGNTTATVTGTVTGQRITVDTP